MSAGEFQNAKYEANNGDIHNIVIQPETIIAGFNVEPTAAVDNDVTAYASASGRKKYGVHARYIRAKWNDPNDVPTGYDPRGRLLIPILTVSSFNSIAKNQTFTYLGKTAQVLTKQSEQVN